MSSCGFWNLLISLALSSVTLLFLPQILVGPEPITERQMRADCAGGGLGLAKETVQRSDDPGLWLARTSLDLPEASPPHRRFFAKILAKRQIICLQLRAARGMNVVTAAIGRLKGENQRCPPTNQSQQRRRQIPNPPAPKSGAQPNLRTGSPASRCRSRLLRPLAAD